VRIYTPGLLFSPNRNAIHVSMPLADMENEVTNPRLCDNRRQHHEKAVILPMQGCNGSGMVFQDGNLQRISADNVCFEEVSMLENGSLLDRIVERIDSGSLKLPVYDPVTLKLQEAIADKTEDVLEIEKIILSDQAVTAEVLRAANSPFFCGLSPVRTVRNAIVRLGTLQMRRLVLLVSERAKYKAHHPDLQAMLRQLWHHSSTTALAAQWLSKRLRSTGIEEICFIGGLLHDIGKLIILKAVDDIKKSERDESPIPRSHLEGILQTAHCYIAYSLLMNWNVPEIYCQIARDHHSEDLPEDLPLAIVRLANEGSRKVGLGLDPNPSLVLSEIQEAKLLKVNDILLVELEEMIEQHLTVAA
jgi:HD-like signal output (HDOD) protein